MSASTKSVTRLCFPCMQNRFSFYLSSFFPFTPTLNFIPFKPCNRKIFFLLPSDVAILCFFSHFLFNFRLFFGRCWLSFGRWFNFRLDFYIQQFIHSIFWIIMNKLDTFFYHLRKKIIIIFWICKILDTFLFQLFFPEIKMLNFKLED